MQDAKQPSKAVIALIVIVLLVAVAGGIVYVNQSKDLSTSTNVSDTTQTDVDTNNAPSTDSESSYTDGTYTATGTYNSPGGQESIDLEVTVNDNIITAANVTPHAASGTSSQYQSEFVGGFKTLVVGKNIDQVTLDRVAGSSLTSNGFNDALDQIKNDAAV